MSSTLGGRARGIWAGNDASSAVCRGQGMAGDQAGARAGELLLLRALRTGETSKPWSAMVRSSSTARPRSRRSSTVRKGSSSVRSTPDPIVITEEVCQHEPFFALDDRFPGISCHVRRRDSSAIGGIRST